jgi:hypothetical protein
VRSATGIVARGAWVVAAAALGLSAFVAPAAAATAPAQAIRKEVLVFTHGPGTSVSVFEEVTLNRPPVAPWHVPLPIGAYRVAPDSPHVRLGRGDRVVADARVDQAAVVYRLPGRLGSVFVQNVALSVGQVAVLAVPGVYPGVGTGLTLHGQTRIADQEFTLFSGGSQGPGGVVHFSLTVGDPGRPWADGLLVLLVLWLAAGAYLASRRLMTIMRDEGRSPDAA